MSSDLLEKISLNIPSLFTVNGYISTLKPSISEEAAIPVIYPVFHQLDQKIIYPHYDFKHLTEKYFEIGMKLDDFLIQLVKYCIYRFTSLESIFYSSEPVGVAIAMVYLIPLLRSKKFRFPENSIYLLWILSPEGY